MALRRIVKELNDMEVDLPSNWSAGPVDDDLFHWKGIIVGPSNTPYADGIFYIDIKFPQNYPFKPPKITYITKIYHCGITDNGGHCIIELKDNWSPAMTISKVLPILIGYLEYPPHFDPLIPEIAKLYKIDRVSHDKKANEWAHKYGHAPLQNIRACKLPKIIQSKINYDIKEQIISCLIQIKHENYKQYKQDINQMYIICDEYKQSISIDKVQYKFEIKKEIGFGEERFIKCKLCRIGYYESSHDFTEKLIVDPLQSHQCLLLIEGYLKNKQINIIPMEIINICFDYYWKYIIHIDYEFINHQQQTKYLKLSDSKRINKYKYNPNQIYDWRQIVKDLIFPTDKRYSNIYNHIGYEMQSHFSYPTYLKIKLNVPDIIELIVIIKHKEHDNIILNLYKEKHEYDVNVIKSKIKNTFDILDTININLSTINSEWIINNWHVYEYIVCNTNSSQNQQTQIYAQLF